MMDPNTAHRTVLLISLGTADAPDSSAAGIAHAAFEEELAFIETALLDCGLCRGTWISNKALIGVFPSADAAFGVACSVQQACRERGHGSLLGEVRMLLDSQAGDPIGAAVPSPVTGVRGLAAQLMNQIPPGQIFATRAVTGHLSELSRARFRLYALDAAGTEAEEQLSQVTCNEETITRMAIPMQYQESTNATPSLKVRWREYTLTVVPESPSLTIGRGDQSDIRIESDLASRIHARLGFQQTNFILTDQSTNGTFVQIDDDEEVYLHHEQIVLRGSGVISLGRQIRGRPGKFIYFKQTA